MALNTNVHNVAKVEREIGYLSDQTQTITFKFLDKTGEVLYEVTAFAADNPANGHRMVEETRYKG